MARTDNNRGRPRPDPDADRSGGVDIGGDAHIEGDVVGRDKITNVAVNRSIIQIGTLVVPTAPVVALLVLVAAILGVLILSALGSIQAPGPAQMQGGFNVAVAEFGQLDAAGQVARSEDGQRLSKVVYDTLRAQIDSFEDKTIAGRVSIWHDSLSTSEKGTTIGIVPDASGAEQLAERIKADIVIYGNLDAQNEFVPQFYISPKVRADVDALLTGHHRLGTQPIRVGASDRLIADTELATRASALTYITIGLTYDVLGRPELSLPVYREAEAKLTTWREQGAGKEILYFFKGQAALFLIQQARPQDVTALDEEAQQAFENALNSNPDYAKANIGLGSVYFLRAQRLQPAQARLESPDMQQTFDQYAEALARSQRDEDSQVETFATFALGTAYFLQGQAYRNAGQTDQARAAFDDAIQRIEATLEPLHAMDQRRFLGQAYHALGLAYVQEAELAVEGGDTVQSTAWYQRARQSLTQCIELDDGADEILQQLVIQNRCVPSLAKVDAALGTPEGGE